MSIRILHTGDVHLGMAFSRYSDPVQAELVQARLATLEKLVSAANQQSCQLMIIAGDLFHNTAPGAELRRQALEILQEFTGVTAILPGNHDYDDGITGLWESIKREKSEKILLLNEQRKYTLDPWGIEADLYPAAGNSRRWAGNQLGWMQDQTLDPSRLAIGVAHGTVENISPGPQGACFYMTRAELDAISVDIWLLGHAHQPFPAAGQMSNPRLLVCGTPEPDGMDYTQVGNAWIIDVSKQQTAAVAYNPARFSFREFNVTVTGETDLSQLEQDMMQGNPESCLVRLNIKGTLEPEVYDELPAFYQRLQERLYYLEIEDEISLNLNPQLIDQQFVQGSFVHRLLTSLQSDPAALRAVYDLVGRVRP